MPIVSNRSYNDPALGAAFSNLAAAFGPPSGSDLAGYAAANAKKQEAARLAEMFAYAKDPNYDQTRADRMSVLGGLYAPSQSYYSVDQSNATTRRGQDVTAATSLKTNAADNARAVQTNAADNARAFAQTRYGPLSQNQMLPALDGSVASLYGVPASGVVQGNAVLNPGETLQTPDGKVIAGAPKPQTKEEVLGTILQGLSPTDQRNVATQGVPVEQIIVGGQPKIVTRNDAVGQTPYNKPTADSATELTKLISERDALPEGDTRRQAYDARIAALGRGQSQSKYDQELDSDLNKLNTSIFENAKGAYAERGLYGTVLAAVDNPSVDQGTLANAKLGLRKALTAFGVPAGDTGPAEMLNALGGQISLKLRNQDGANMPGAMSDADRQFLQSMSVSLGNSPQANRLLAQYYLGIQQRAVDLNDLRETYVQQHGRVDEGFRSEVAKYLRNADPTAKLKAELGGSGGAPAAAAPAAAPAASAAPVHVTTPEEASRLPSGTPIILPDGTPGRVP